MVKQPDILIADEPCQGLDSRHRERVLSLLSIIGEWPETTLLYVTHDPLEELSSCTHHLKMVPHEEGGYTVKSGPYLSQR
jgi:molybdate transport system ATP-binding protein